MDTKNPSDATGELSTWDRVALFGLFPLFGNPNSYLTQSL
jgi:hypothetical protein